MFHRLECGEACVHVCACVYLRAHICKCAHPRTCVHPHVCTCGPTCVYVHAWVCVPAHVWPYTCVMCVCMHGCVYARVGLCPPARVCMHTCGECSVVSGRARAVQSRTSRRGLRPRPPSSFVHPVLGLWLRSGRWSWVPQMLTATSLISHPLVDLDGQDCLLTGRKDTLEAPQRAAWEGLVGDPCAGGRGWGSSCGPRSSLHPRRQGAERGEDPGDSQKVQFYS